MGLERETCVFFSNARGDLLENTDTFDDDL